MLSRVGSTVWLLLALFCSIGTDARSQTAQTSGAKCHCQPFVFLQARMSSKCRSRLKVD